MVRTTPHVIIRSGGPSYRICLNIPPLFTLIYAFMYLEILKNQLSTLFYNNWAKSLSLEMDQCAAAS
jgi:hypothetical protein